MIGFSLIETGFEYLLSILAGTEVTSGISFEYTGFISEVLIFITVVLVGPVLEELVFRGVICRALTRFGKGFAVVASSLLFALMHLNMTQAVPVFGFALVLGYVYLKTDSLQVPVILHVINNLIAQTSTYLGDTGSTVLTLIEVAVAIAGVILVVMHRKDFKGWSAFTEKGNEGWSALRKSIAFWVFVALFVIASIISFASPSFSL
jgi:membrane protease YdiL (CAAX protease family)